MVSGTLSQQVPNRSHAVVNFDLTYVGSTTRLWFLRYSGDSLDGRVNMQAKIGHGKSAYRFRCSFGGQHRVQHLNLCRSQLLWIMLRWRWWRRLLLLWRLCVGFGYVPFSLPRVKRGEKNSKAGSRHTSPYALASSSSLGL